ncbi:cecropin-B [Anopheles maculipalpis]|uniref:cecropin-B n=1 Tax=Anopheles maculipalpis TaxID=1496333 RepID=UPI002159093E|nr:cecropin-B [Anopheles maculipalpis]
MNFTKLFILVAIAVLVVVGVQPVDGAPRWKFGKRLERLGRNVFRAAKKALPVIAGYKALG